MNLRLRPARNDDAPVIAEILGDWVDQTPWLPRVHDPDEDGVLGDLLIEKTEVTVAESRGVVGFLAQRGHMIDALYVAGAVRGQGVGSALIDAAKARAGRLELWAYQENRRARAFYAAHGFTEVQCTDGDGNDEKLPDVKLCWTQEDAV